MNRKTKWAVAAARLVGRRSTGMGYGTDNLSADHRYRLCGKECGSCHMVYPPELLPARSWTKIMGSLQDHFGDCAQLDAATQQHIHDYLVAHAADKSQNEHSVAIMQSFVVGGDAVAHHGHAVYLRTPHRAARSGVGWQTAAEDRRRMRRLSLSVSERQLRLAEFHSHRRGFSQQPLGMTRRYDIGSTCYFRGLSIAAE